MVVEGDSRVASCAKGTRPGDPLADIIFNVAMYAALDMFVKERPTNPHVSYVVDTTAFVTHNCPRQLLKEVDSTMVLSRTDHTGQEVAARIKNMHVHYHPLARNVFLSEHLGEMVKSSLAKSLLWSVLFKGAGTWVHIGTCWIKKIGGCTGLCFARHVWQLSWRR